jgi:F0F1-type ATP synthase assembly protein I
MMEFLPLHEEQGPCRGCMLCTFLFWEKGKKILTIVLLSILLDIQNLVLKR